MVRVSRHHPCPVCGKHKGCGVADYGDFLLVHCVRVSEGARRESATGWVHRLPKEGGSSPWREMAARLPEKTAPLAPLAQRVAVYEAIVKMLSLETRHRQHLLEVRGLSPRAIVRHEFRSLPSGLERRRLIQRLLDRFGPDGLRGVPGFWKDAQGRWQLGGAAGLLIPIRTVRGRVYALQTRPDDGDAVSAKYTLVSSGTRPEGASSGTPYHWAWPRSRQVKDEKTVILTEGPLKAIVIAECTGYPVMAATSAYTWRVCLSPLARLKPRQVLLAWDNDWRENPAVRRQMEEAATALRDLGLEVARLQWDPAYKGLDDYLLAGRRVAGAEA